MQRDEEFAHYPAGLLWCFITFIYHEPLQTALCTQGPPNSWGTLPKICLMVPWHFPLSIWALACSDFKRPGRNHRALAVLCGVPPWIPSSQRGFPIATSQPESTTEKCLIEPTHVKLAFQNLCCIKATLVTLYSVQEHLFLHSVKAFIQLLALSSSTKKC